MEKSDFHFYLLVSIITVVGFGSFLMTMQLNDTDHLIIEAVNRQFEEQDKLNQALVTNSEISQQIEVQLIENLMLLCEALEGCEMEIIVHDREELSIDDEV